MLLYAIIPTPPYKVGLGDGCLVIFRSRFILSDFLALDVLLRKTPRSWDLSPADGAICYGAARGEGVTFAN